ncbi:MAG: hypothetical protein ABEJ72_03105 [Candidatus Aenigmatarchaeota archaeon]
MTDNRRRIKPKLLNEIEEYEGDTFTEQLLNWNRNQDKMSVDVDEIREVIKSQLHENLNRQVLDQR